MIRNVGAQNNSTILNDMKKNDVHDTQNIEKQAIEKQSRVDELKKQIVNGDYQIDLRATATKMAQELKPDL
ncbi:flagellar biosynthesis anti-sigma factor FlgM [Hydrogenimonas sp.]|uniref:flagellar biosynthesis anti-sigma factor FlgM n=1 Tax=Hydrogenimonas sp. TaxID=2231112 RepID=UPI002621EBFD|nr:flagellar biosynthesis anti-sigma factor FlgM [Hydrogenimonas sp.]